MGNHASSPLLISLCSGRLPFPPETLHRSARCVVRSEKLPPQQKISIVFCSDRTIRRLNARYRGIDRPTDVLSFNLDEPDLLGEIYVSLRRARLQAAGYGVSFREEVLRLFLHGFLHLLGHDHERPADRAAMEKKMRKYLSSLLKIR